MFSRQISCKPIADKQRHRAHHTMPVLPRIVRHLARSAGASIARARLHPRRMNPIADPDDAAREQSAPSGVCFIEHRTQNVLDARERNQPLIRDATRASAWSATPVMRGRMQPAAHGWQRDPLDAVDGSSLKVERNHRALTMAAGGTRQQRMVASQQRMVASQRRMVASQRRMADSQRRMADSQQRRRVRRVRTCAPRKRLLHRSVLDGDIRLRLHAIDAA